MKTTMINIVSNTDLPIGALLMRLRGATKNLMEAITSIDKVLIYKRRIELSAIVAHLSKGYERQRSDSLINLRIQRNIDISMQTAKTMLYEASLQLASSLEILPVSF